MKFQAPFTYNHRKDAPKYIWHKYRPILTESILDVGGGEYSLRPHLPEDVRYTAIGFGKGVDMRVNLEDGPLPFSDGEFEVVLCSDVLEHLECIHFMFDELCRVSKNYVIISLPNPWSTFYSMLRHGFHNGPEEPMMFYSLPVDPPPDRHRWFFAPHESEKFLRVRAGRNNMNLVQLDYIYQPKKRLTRMLLHRMFFHKDITLENLKSGTQWTVLQKRQT